MSTSACEYRHSCGQVGAAVPSTASFLLPPPRPPSCRPLLLLLLLLLLVVVVLPLLSPGSSRPPAAVWLAAPDAGRSAGTGAPAAAAAKSMPHAAHTCNQCIAAMLAAVLATGGSTHSRITAAAPVAWHLRATDTCR
jgi:hypothetical protein